MPKDVIVVVNLDAKPNPSEALDILILSTAGPIEQHRAQERRGEAPALADARAAYPQGLDGAEGGRRPARRGRLARPSGAHLSGRGH